VDYNLGRIRNELEARGFAENTVIIYTSDHGSHFRTRNREYKRSCHEASLRIPLVVWGPGFNAGGRRIEDIVSLIDVPSSVLTAAGLTPPSEMQGRPLQWLVAGRPAGWREQAFVQISESQVGRALRTDRWKYAVRAPNLDGRGPQFTSDVYEEEFLYDLRTDPHERHNLVAEPAYSEVLHELRRRLLDEMRKAGEPPARIVPNGFA